MAEERLGSTNKDREEERKKKTRNRTVNPIQTSQGSQGVQGTTLGDNSGTGANSDTGTSGSATDSIIDSVINSESAQTILGSGALGLAGDVISRTKKFGEDVNDRLQGRVPDSSSDSSDLNISDLQLNNIGSAARGLVEESEAIDASNLGSATELGVLNDPNTIRGPSGSDTIAASDLQLQATSRISDDGTGTTFDFNDSSGSVGTRDNEGAQRIASGLAIRGVQAPTFNTENLIASNRADEIQRIIREGKASGRPTEDILAQVRSIRARGGTRLGGDNSLQGQLDRVDELEESGALNSAFAQGRRNRINKQIASNQQGSAELSVSQFNAQTTRAKNVADDLNKQNKTRLERFNTINKLLTESGTSLGVVVQQFGVEGLNASQQALDLKSQLVQDLREFTDPSDRKDLAEQFLEELGLPISNLNLVQEFVQG